MKKHVMMGVAALALALGTGAALASDCPNLSARIQAALDTGQGTTEARGSAKVLLMEGQRLHEAGDHAKSVQVLGQAMQELGIE